MISNNYYTELELNNFASDDEIRAQYKKLMKLHHPDKGGDHCNFIKFQSAYEFLTNKDIRTELDNKLIIEEEILEKSEELNDYSIELLGKNQITFSCWQCGTKNIQKLTEELVYSFSNKLNTVNDTLSNTLTKDFSNSKGTRILLECNSCSLKYKISRIKT